MKWLIRRYQAKRRPHGCIACSDAVLHECEQRGALTALRFWWHRCRKQHAKMNIALFAAMFVGIIGYCIQIAFLGYYSDDVSGAIMQPVTAYSDICCIEPGLEAGAEAGDWCCG